MENNYEREVYKFIDNYFKEIDNISEFHLKFFIKNNIPTIDLNVLILHKFIFQAYNYMKSNNISFSKFLIKLEKDIKSLLNFLIDFEKKIRILDNVFEDNFLNNFQEYKFISLKIEDKTNFLHNSSFTITSLENEMKYFNPKTKEEEKEFKALKKRWIDSIHYNAKAKEDISKLKKEQNILKDKLKYIFLDNFKNSKKAYISKLKLVINTKLYYFNKEMWLEINKNSSYLKKLGLSKLNITIYINNYLKHIDISKAKNYEEYLKIEEVLKELNE